MAAVMVTVCCIADKPNYVVPASQPTEQQLQAAHDKLATLANEKHAEHTPAQIYSLPYTSSMEYGFWQGQFLQTVSRAATRLAAEASPGTLCCSRQVALGQI